MIIQIGNIVTVTLKDCFLQDKQGEVVEIKDNKDGPVGVLFDRRDIMEYTSSRKERIIHFEYNELRLEDDWNIENQVQAFYGSMPFRVYTLKFPFNTKNDCMHEGCPLKTTRRIIVNTHGVVLQKDTCDEHGDDYHGKCVDTFPDKPNYKPVTSTAEAS